MKIQENVSLKNHTTMQIGGKAKFFCIAESESDIIEACQFARDNGLDIFPLGEGSNTIFKSESYNKLFILMKNTGITKSYEGPEMVNLEVCAGENWDNLVKWSVSQKLSGLECLSGIPGTVGAAPIQNIGAYGSEAKDTITKVKVLDLESNEIFELPNSQCDFSYRNSIFKKNLGKFIILTVSFNLSKNHKNLPIPQYKDIQLYFAGKQKSASADEIRKAVLEIRSRKIPWPSDVPNSGSFFQNPIVDKETASRIAIEFPEMPYFQIDDNKCKLYAGWLIEKCKLKGFKFGKIKICDHNALIITNPDGAGEYKNLEQAVAQIQAQVYQQFEIELEIEPNII
jgi:UDP-N-acetylmuramate dehydrogenase